MMLLRLRHGRELQLHPFDSSWWHGVMEGSGRSSYPTLFYRDSVTLSLDQNTNFANLIPPMNKDSLGVWVSQIRWANFMGKERWREALVMDLGRGSLVFPQIWGDPHLLDDGDVSFLAGMIALARDNEPLFLKPRISFGDPWKNDVYGYAFWDGARGFAFCHNGHFTPRRLQLPLGAQRARMRAASQTAVTLTTRFPEAAEIASPNGEPFRIGSTAELWMRPFETTLVEITPKAPSGLPLRPTISDSAEAYGRQLPLQDAPAQIWMALEFAERLAFEQAGLRRTRQIFSAILPTLRPARYLLAVTVQ